MKKLLTRSTIKDFTKVWNTSDTRKDVADKLGVPVTAVGNFANRLRQKGLKLKSMNPRDAYPATIAQTLDWNKVVAGYMAKLPACRTPRKVSLKRAKKSHSLVRIVWKTIGW